MDPRMMIAMVKAIGGNQTAIDFCIAYGEWCRSDEVAKEASRKALRGSNRKDHAAAMRASADGRFYRLIGVEAPHK